MRLGVEAGDRGVHGPNGCSRGGKVLSTTRWCAKRGMGRGRLRWEAARTRYGGAAARLGVQRLLLVDQALEQAFLLPDLDLDRLLLALSFSVLSLAKPSRLLRSSSTFRIRRCTRSKSDSPAAAPLMSAIVLTVGGRARTWFVDYQLTVAATSDSLAASRTAVRGRSCAPRIPLR
jgi:hypothetical protein